MQIRRKKNKQAKRARREQQKRERAATRGRGRDSWIEIVVGYDGQQHGFFDDCPICQELRASGEPVFTLGPDGELVLMSGTAPGEGSIN